MSNLEISLYFYPNSNYYLKNTYFNMQNVCKSSTGMNKTDDFLKN